MTIKWLCCVKNCKLEGGKVIYVVSHPIECAEVKIGESVQLLDYDIGDLSSL